MALTAEQDTKQEAIQTVTDSGTPEARRIATPEAAFSVFDKLLRDDEADAKRRATLQGMNDGNAPYSQTELEELGLGSMINVNFMSMRANLDARAAAAHELFAEVPTLIEVTPFSADPQEALVLRHYAQILEEEFTTMVSEWRGFLPMMDLSVREADLYGIGPVLFPDVYDWRPKAFRRGNLLIDAKAKVDVDENDVYLIRDEYTAGDLFAKIADLEVAEIGGWKPENVKSILIDVFKKDENGNKDDDYQRSVWESIQQMHRNNDPWFQQRQFQRVKVVHFLVREVSGARKVTHLIIPENKNCKSFLCERHDVFDNVGSALWWLTFNYGDGYARSVRGVASFMAPHDDLSNRYLSRVFDTGFMTAGVILQPQTQLDLSRLQFTNFGPYTILPPELKVQNAQIGSQMGSLIQLREVSESIMRNNTGTYRPHAEGTESAGERKTARQVVEEVSKEARFEKAAVAHRYNQYDLLYREMFRRATAKDLFETVLGKACSGYALAEKFRQRCKDRGVTHAMFHDATEKFRLRATRAIGLGSLGVRYDLTNQLLQARALFDEVGQINAVRDWLAARVGYSNVDRYKTQIDRDAVPSSETSHAVLENNDLSEGTPVLAGSDQMHKTHIVTLVSGLIVPLLQALEQRQISDPQRALQTLMVAGQHLEAHLKFVIQDPAFVDLVKTGKEVLSAVQKAIGQLTRVVQQMQVQQMKMQQENQQRLQQADQVLKDRELEAKIYEINKKAELERMKQESLNDARTDKTVVQMDIAKMRAEADVRLKAAIAEADMRIKEVKAQQGRGEGA